MKKLVLLVAAIVVLFFAFASIVKAEDAAVVKPSITVDEMATVSAKVLAIDYAKRIVTIQIPDGTVMAIKVDESAKNLDQVVVGDEVDVDYYKSVAISVRGPSDQPPVAWQENVMEAAPKGDKPGRFQLQVTQVTADVVGIDYTNRTVSVKGPQGNVITYDVSEDVKNFDQIKLRDQVAVNVTEAIAISVKKPK